MLVKPISAPPADASAVPVRFEVEDVMAEIGGGEGGVPVVDLAVSARLSLLELTATMVEAFKFDPKIIDGLSLEYIRHRVAVTFAWEGITATHAQIERRWRRPPTADEQAYWDRCEAKVRAAFGLPEPTVVACPEAGCPGAVECCAACGTWHRSDAGCDTPHASAAPTCATCAGAGVVGLPAA